MKMTKRLLSILLAAILLFSVLPMTALAAESDDAETGAAADLGELGFIADYAEVGDAELNIKAVSTAEQLKDALEWPDESRINVITLTTDIYEQIGTPGDHSDADSIRYWATVAKGKKILVLNGYNLNLVNDYSVITDHYSDGYANVKNQQTLFNVPEGAELNVIGMDNKKSYSVVKYLGALMWKCDAVDQRDLFEVNGGSLTFNGGYYRIDSTTQKYEVSGGVNVYYQMNGTSVQVNSGSLTINSGSFEGRGYKYHIGPGMTNTTSNGAIEVYGNPEITSVVINDGNFIGTSKAKPADIVNEDLFASGAVQIRAGVFEMDRSRARIATHYESNPGRSEDVSALGLNLTVFDDNANYYFYDAGANPEFYDAKGYSDLYNKNGFQYFAVNPKKGWEEFTTLPNEPTSLVDNHRGSLYASAKQNSLIGTWDGKSAYKVYVDSEDLYFPPVRYREDGKIESGYGLTPNGLSGEITVKLANGTVFKSAAPLKLYYDAGAQEFYYDLKEQFSGIELAKLKVGNTYQIEIKFTEQYKGFYYYQINHDSCYRVEIGSELTAVFATIDKPVAGDHPVMTAEGSENYDVSVKWKTLAHSELFEASTFAADTQYEAQVTFTAKNGAKFSVTNDVSCIVNGFERRILEKSADKLVCTLILDTTEELTPITNTIVYLRGPQLLYTLPDTAYASNGNVSIVEWRLVSNDHVLGSSDRVRPGETYRVYFDLTPAAGTVFGIEAGSYTIVKVQNQTDFTTVTAKKAANGLYFADFTFPAEFDEASCTITAPEAGRHPSFDAVAGESGAGVDYDCIVSRWEDSEGNELTVEDVFAKNKTYRAVVRFVGVGGTHPSADATVTINGVAATREDEDLYYVDLTTTGTWSIDRVDARVTEPVPGEWVSDTDVSGNYAQMKYASVMLSGWEGPGIYGETTGVAFRGGSTYKCYVTFRAKDGYSFSPDTKFYINGKEATQGGGGDGETFMMMYTTFTTEDLSDVIDFVVLGGFEMPKAGQGASRISYHYNNIDVMPGECLFEVLKTSTKRAVWLDDEGNTFTGTFEGGKDYTLQVPVRALSNCSFTGAGLKANISGLEAGVEYTDNKNITVKLTVTVPEAENIIEEASATVIAPEDGVRPSTHIESGDTSAYGCRVKSWYKTGSDTEMGYSTFKKGESYDVVAEFYPMTDYGFSPLTVFTINGKEGTVIKRNGGEVTVRATIDPDVLYLSEISATVTAPEADAKQSFDAIAGDDAAYTVTDVDWYIDGHKEPMHPTDKFEAGKTYVCAVMFRLNDGYEADYDTKFVINGIESDAVTYGSPVFTAKVKFTVAGESSATEISELELFVMEPVVGERPVYLAGTPSDANYAIENYSDGFEWLNGVNWCDDTGWTMLPSSRVFKDSEQYFVQVTVVPASKDYEFASEVTATINGEVAVVQMTTDGNLLVSTSFTVVAPATQTVLLGDADDDGKVTILDATAIQRVLAALPVVSFVTPAADADRDTKITILDATAIQRYLAALPTNPLIGTLVEPLPIK